jgi:radical SAM-linked protein
VSEVKQRWRIVFARGEEARYLSHLDAVKGWERAFRRGDIPIATTEGFSPRSKLVFAAPLQLGMLAERELADLFLAERLTSPDLRARLSAGMPNGYTVVAMHDVWSGAPALATQLVAADYRMTLLNVEHEALRAAAERLFAAERLPRQRRKESRTITYDLRPLLLELRVGAPDADADTGAGAGLWMRLRLSQNDGSGRPDQVVAALADDLGMRTVPTPGASDDEAPITAPGVAPANTSAGPDADASPTPAGSALEVVRPVRERLWLDEEFAQPAAGPVARSPRDDV